MAQYGLNYEKRRNKYSTKARVNERAYGRHVKIVDNELRSLAVWDKFRLRLNGAVYVVIKKGMRTFECYCDSDGQTYQISVFKKIYPGSGKKW